MKKIIVLCTGNSCRSQMAHGYLQHYSKGKFEIYSAGLEAHGLNPRAVNVMKEDGIDIASHTSNTIEDYPGIEFDYILTVCDHAQENCPYLPGKGKRFHKSFPDPAKATGSEENILARFRSVRDEIKGYCKDFIDKLEQD